VATPDPGGVLDWGGGAACRVTDPPPQVAALTG
jgi:hypothetical protein